jgi:hypothetical protein
MMLSPPARSSPSSNQLAESLLGLLGWGGVGLKREVIRGKAWRERDCGESWSEAGDQSSSTRRVQVHNAGAAAGRPQDEEVAPPHLAAYSCTHSVSTFMSSPIKLRPVMEFWFLY